MSLNKNNIQNYQCIRSQWDKKTKEKTIETEFYHLIKQYYENEFENHSGSINYNSPYNIDGLITIKTIDENISILIEAKTNKKYQNKQDRNAVLAQTIYYLKTIIKHNDLIPAIIILLERNSLVVYETEQLLPFTDTDYNWKLQASNPDSILIKDLNNSNLHYTYYDLNKDDLNSIFQQIDHYCKTTNFKEKKFKTYSYKPVNNTIISSYADDFIKENDFVFDGLKNTYYFKNNNSSYSKVSEYFFEKMIYNFIKNKNIVYDDFFIDNLIKKVLILIYNDNFTLKSPNLISEWFNDLIISSSITKDNFILISDLHASYNDWSIARNNSKLSIRNFINLFKNHDVFQSNNLEYVKSGFIRKDDTRSEYVSPSTGEIKEIPNKPTFVRGIKFKS